MILNFNEINFKILFWIYLPWCYHYSASYRILNDSVWFTTVHFMLAPIHFLMLLTLNNSSYIYFTCPSVYLYPINGWTDRAQILCIWPHMKLYECSISKLCLQQFSILIDNPRFCFIKSANFFCFCFTLYTKRKCFIY